MILAFSLHMCLTSPIFHDGPPYPLVPSSLEDRLSNLRIKRQNLSNSHQQSRWIIYDLEFDKIYDQKLYLDATERRWSASGDYTYINNLTSFSLVKTKFLRDYLESNLDTSKIVKIEGHGLNLSLKPKEVVVLNKKSFKIATNANKHATSSSLGKGTGHDRSEKKEDISLDKSVQVKSDVNINIYTSWKDNYWIIESESLKNIASILERKFDVTIHIESPELNQYTFTGTFYKETLEQILDILKLTAPLRYEIKEGIVVIKGEHKRKSIYDNFKY